MIGAFRNFELNQMDLIEKPGRAFYVEEEGVPAYDELILVASRAAAGEPKIAHFVQAVERATQYLINHPAASWELFVAYDKSLDDELNKRAWRDTLPRFALRPAALDQGRYRRFAAFLAEQGLIDKPPPLADYAVELSAPE